MRKLFISALVITGAFLFVPSARAQFTTVTATVKDSNGIPYANGTMSAVLVPGASGGYTLSGAPYSGRVGPVTLDSTGKFVANFGDVTLISPGSPQWQITVNSNQGGIAPPLGTSAQTFTITTTGTTISGSSPVDISTTLNAAAPKLTNITLGAGTVTSVSATGPIVATPNPIVGTGTISCPTCISGSISSTQVAFGSGANVIAGDASFTFATATKLLSVNGLVITQPSQATIGFTETNTMIAGASFTATLENGGDYLYSYVSQTPGNQIFQQYFPTAIWQVTTTNGVGNPSLQVDPTFPGVTFDNPVLFSFNSSTGQGIFGIDNSTAGTLQLANATAAAHTIWGSAATTTNTILGFATSPTTNHLISCVKSGTTCTLTDSGTVAGGAVLSSITAATGSHTIANGNNPQTWNWTLTTDAINAMSFGETSAATNGTLTNGLANQGIVSISTATNSTATPLEVVQGSITNTVATPLVQFEATWNNTGLTGAGIVLNVTNTASAAGSLLENLQVGNVSQWKVDKAGNIAATGTVSCGLAGTTSCVITGAGATSGTATITWPAVSGTTTNAIVSSNNWSAPILTATANGAASTPSVSVTGTPFSAGSGTTTVPLVYLNGGAAPTTWNTSGTYFGVNAIAGFAGELMDLRVNGGNAMFSVNTNGNAVSAGSFTAQQGLASTFVSNSISGPVLFYITSNPTIAAGGCGGAAASIPNKNGTLSFQVNVGTGNSGTCTITMPVATTGWTCGSVSDITTTSATVYLSKQTGALSSTSITLKNFSTAGANVAWTDSDVLNVSCAAT